MKNGRGFGLVSVIITAGILAVLVAGGIGVYGYLNGLRSVSVGYETSLNAQYLDNQNYLSAYVSGFYEMLGIANLKSEKMDKILLDAVKGRYGEKGFSSQGAFFAAVVEAYPDIKGLDVYDKIMDYVSAKREGYRAIQSKLLDMLRSYDKWREDGLVQSRIIESVLGIPSDRLEARIGESVKRGKDAREQMYVIVLADQAADAYKSGRMAPLQVK